MIINDFITSTERLTFVEEHIEDFYNNECTGCGSTTKKLVDEYECTYEEIEENSITTSSGLWYCHIDCFRDSR